MLIWSNSRLQTLWPSVNTVNCHLEFYGAKMGPYQAWPLNSGAEIVPQKNLGVQSDTYDRTKGSTRPQQGYSLLQNLKRNFPLHIHVQAP